MGSAKEPDQIRVQGTEAWLTIPLVTAPDVPFFSHGLLNTQRCTLCSTIALQKIVDRGITLPLAPYKYIWSRSSFLDSLVCGLCQLMGRSVNWRKNRRFDVLHLSFNAFKSLIVLAVTTKWRLRNADGEIACLCGKDGDFWMHEFTTSSENCAAAFLRLYRHSDSFSPLNIRVSLPSPHAGSDACFVIGRQWLEHCRSTHPPPCRRKTSFVPSRLVAVGEEKFPGSIRLVSFTTASQSRLDVEYAALSYCWGSSSFLTTTSFNIADMHRSIAVDSLPQTITDAIRVTRRLGIRYLWVDSLCIIQGSDDEARNDWTIESQRMGEIFSTACVTIAAESTSCASLGFLSSRSHDVLSAVAVPLHPDRPEFYYLGSYLSATPSREPLHSRGWALQESIMAHRLLNFGTNHMSWKCSYATDTELKTEFSNVGQQGLFQRLHTRSSLKKGFRTYHNWQTLVQTYTACLLTKPTDRLPAILGLAAMIKTEVRDEFYAGMWKSRLATDLLWSPVRTAEQSSHLSEACSWSWVSMSGPVTFLNARSLGGTFDFDYSIPHGAFPGSPVLMVKSFIQRIESVDYREHALDGKGALRTSLDVLMDIPREHIQGSSGKPRRVTNVWFLRLAERLGKSCGLILLPIPGYQMCFRRIGIFEGDFWDKWTGPKTIYIS